jgi:hypothetical protein
MKNHIRWKFSGADQRNGERGRKRINAQQECCPSSDASIATDYIRHFME